MKKIIIEREKSEKKKILLADTLEGFFKRIREVQIFLILLGGDWYGSGLRVGSEDAHVSYWEAELFYAILLGKEIHVIEVKGFKAEGKLEILLNMLRRALPRTAWTGPYERTKVVRTIHQYLLEQIDASSDQQKAFTQLGSALVNGLFRLRGIDGRGGTAEKELLLFFDGSVVDSTILPNESVIALWFYCIKQNRR